MDLSSSSGAGEARDRLLTRLLDTFEESLPSPQMSLREIATRAGTSHALLRYHFGSLAGVLAAMLTVQRSRDNEALIAMAAGGTFDELVVAIWRSYTRPGQLSRIRGFFHVVGLAAYNPGDFREFIESLDDLTRVLAALAEREGRGTQDAHNRAAVAVAAIRGLLLHRVLSPTDHFEDPVALILSMTKPERAPGARTGR